MIKNSSKFNKQTITSLFLGGLVTVCALLCTNAHAASSEYNIEMKTSQFDEVLGATNSAANTANDDALADKIRKQRAALNAQSARETATQKTKSTQKSGINDCDQKLRACIKSKCGNDFGQCSGDTDTAWGNKMDLCRRDTQCTGEEYRLFSTEIKADRDMNAKLSQYTSVIDCGNEYNNCIITECGQKFTNCLGKSAGDKAIQKCAKIATNCKQQDSGLSSRAMEVFGNLRGNAEKAIARDEQRLYELRDAMRDTCNRLGAMFDERSLDCVYTVNFYAGEDNTLYASKKAYAGSTFDCTQNWFGVDITTFMENAFRLTRAQTSASSAALGAGVGMAAGAITSGAIDRATDRAKAERALGEELCTTTGGTWQKAINRCKCEDTKSFDEESGCIDDTKKKGQNNQTADRQSNRNTERNKDNISNNNKTTKEQKKSERKNAQELKKTQKQIEQNKTETLKTNCELGGRGKWTNNKCKCTNENDTWDKNTGLCTSLSSEETNKIAQEANTTITTCEKIYHGQWNIEKQTCDCPGIKVWKNNMCIDMKNAI